jgi:hypothetical protein
MAIAPHTGPVPKAPAPAPVPTRASNTRPAAPPDR